MIMFFVLIFFGAKRLPELARSMGLAVREFSKAKDEFTNQLTSPPAERPVAAPQKEALSVPVVATVMPEPEKKAQETTV